MSDKMHDSMRVSNDSLSFFTKNVVLVNVSILFAPSLRFSDKKKVTGEFPVTILSVSV